MKLHMFGSKSIKTKDDLKKVTIPTGAQSEATDIWTMDEQDALHVPILGSKSEQDEDTGQYKPDLLNPFGVYVSEEAKNDAPLLSVIENEDIPTLLEEEVSNPTEELSAALDHETISSQDDEILPTPMIKESRELIIGVYASSELYVRSIEKELAQSCDADIHCFDASMNEGQITEKSDINMWIINLSDDDESPLLDSILEISSDHPSLYLSGSLTKHCKQSILSFLDEN